MIRRALFLALCLLFAAGIANGEETPLSGTVRVSLTSLAGREEIHLSFDGAYTIGDEIPVTRGAAGELRAEEGKAVLFVDGAEAARGKTIFLRRHLAAGQNGLRIREARLPANLYPGDLLIEEDDGCLRLVFYVYIEDYLLGVLPYEMDDTFPLEALKAQAVAARTYALRKMALMAPEYDLVDTSADQVYCGTPGECENAVQAVSETWGQVGLSEGGFMPTWYTASNGGQTESAQHAWGGKAENDFPVKDDPYDLENGNAAVRTVLFFRSGTTSSEGLNLLLSARAARLTGIDSPRITGIAGVSVSAPKYEAPSRLYTVLTVEMNVAGFGPVRAEFDYFSEIEALCGLSLNVLENELISVTEGEAGFVLSARRLGHGVGMSQRGAEEMARRGMTAGDILAFYYPGSRRETYTLTRQILPALDGLTYPDSAPVLKAEQRIVRPGHALDAADLRSAPREDAPLLLRLSYGTRVALLNEGPEYSLVQSGLTAGYVKNTLLLAQEEEPETPQPQAGEISARVRLSDEEQMLNLRAAPGATGEVIGHLRNGERLVVLMSYGSWSCVRSHDTIGFVKSEYLEPEAASAAESRQAAAGEETGKMRGEELAAPESEQPQAAYAAAMDADGEGSIPARAAAAGGLVLRAAPAPQAEALCVMPDGAQLSILSFDIENGYVRVRYEGTEGYAAIAYLMRPDGEENGHTQAPSQPTPVPPPSRVLQQEETAQPEGYRVAVTSSNGLHLRAAPRADGESLYVLPYGTVLEVTGPEEDGFLPVRWGAYRGYVAEAYTGRLP